MQFLTGTRCGSNKTIRELDSRFLTLDLWTCFAVLSGASCTCFGQPKTNALWVWVWLPSSGQVCGHSRWSLLEHFFENICIFACYHVYIQALAACGTWDNTTSDSEQDTIQWRTSTISARMPACAFVHRDQTNEIRFENTCEWCYLQRHSPGENIHHWLFRSTKVQTCNSPYYFRQEQALTELAPTFEPATPDGVNILICKLLSKYQIIPWNLQRRP